MATTMIPTWTTGDRLRKARMAAGLSGPELAKVLGVAPKTINNYEAERHERKRHVVMAWALATGVALDWLEAGDDRPQPDGSSSADRRAAATGANTQGDLTSLWIYDTDELVAA